MSAAANSPTRVAIVSGAARGIGASIALRLAADGHDIAVLDLDAEACSDTVRAIRALGRRAMAVAADVAEESAVERAVAEVVAAPIAATVRGVEAGLIDALTSTSASPAMASASQPAYGSAASPSTRAPAPVVA